MNQEQEYIKWKRWCKDDFAKLSKNEELYFDKEIFSAKKNPKSIFEIGFGNGHFYSWCYKNHIEYAGTEINKVLLDMANRNKIKVFYTLDDINEKFDMVVAFDVFEHMTNEDIISTLIKIKKIYLRMV
jgi:2-polyprenyl-3-methyl-5-hydroxy-6-metoxy-1,4-benzoquinol methylase